MRKLKRYQLHVEAGRQGAKEGTYFNRMWDRYQRIRYGAAGRSANQRIGTRRKRNWGGFRHPKRLRRTA